MDLITQLKAIMSRLLFIAHGIAAVYIYWEYQVKRGKHLEDNKFDFFLLAPLFFILVEAVITLWYRKGVEFKYFWPSGFFYITCLVPIIWLIELDLVDQRARGSDGGNANTNTNDVTASENQQEKGQRFLNAKVISDEGVKKVSELGLVLGVIIGRWLIPRGTLTRDQLSALLLGYVSNSADILELFSTFEEQEVFDNKDVTIAVMVVFTIALYQFPLVTTATMEIDDNNSDLRNNKIRPATYSEQLKLQNGSASKRGYISDIKTRRITSQSLSDKRGSGGGKKSSSQSTKKRTPQAINEDQTDQKENTIKRRKFHGEVFQILVTLLMQDGPFFILRFYLIVKFGVTSELHIFFTCKNAIVSILLVYRLLILSCSEPDESLLLQQAETEMKLRNIQRALETMKLKDIKPTNMYVR